MNTNIKKMEAERNYVGEFCAVCDRLSSLYEKKNKSYGNSFSRKYWKWHKRLAKYGIDGGLLSALIRIDDKYERIESIAEDLSLDTCGETIQDTLIDLACYCIMTMMELDYSELKQEQNEDLKEDIDGLFDAALEKAIKATSTTQTKELTDEELDELEESCDK